MKKILALVVLVFLMAACAPAARPVPGAEAIFYAADKDLVYAAVVEIISTAPGIDNSNGWIITQSDSEGGFIRTETAISTTVTEALSVVVSQSGTGRSQVVIQRTSGGAELAERIRTTLDQRFNRSS